jgi:CHAT domain-containing protein
VRAILRQLDSKRLQQLIQGDGSKPGIRGGWLGAYQLQYLKGRELDARFREWLGAIQKVGLDLWVLFGEALDRALKERGVKPGARLVMLPAGSLGLLSLGLAQEPDSGRRLGDAYEIVFAPSLEALAAVSHQVARPPDPSLVAAINPTGDLPFAEVEGAVIAADFVRMSHSLIRLDRSTARLHVVLAALKGRTYWHFASHGKFDWNDVRASGLLMRDETLSISRLLTTEGGLGRPRLVVLSACETGLYDIDRNPEEFVGLPATFLRIGAAGVVSSLWPVDDLATRC